MIKTAPFSMRLPPDLKVALQAMAEAEKRSLTNYVEKVLSDHVERMQGADARKPRREPRRG